MALAANGYFRRLTRRLTEDIDQLDAEEMANSSQASGAQRACDCSRGEEVTMLGRLRSVEACPKSSNASVEAEFFDGTDAVTLVWIGRRRIAGIEPGKKLKVRGRLGDRNGQKVIYNPYYELSGDA
ncbi:DNA-binding protein [Rhodococcus spelaei]|uniref:DNA-binding protein n=1 Tax=Rhodococcus spelaei TaxID=2546320 RepID=A0A541B1U1_9NOCA|nr:OB-fold nucleic acid binding domain-containing protein [Rhodococcus spelaei]TQF66289.1 DNA-binding protein [Rhodococcus spelaei]